MYVTPYNYDSPNKIGKYAKKSVVIPVEYRSSEIWDIKHF